MNLSSLENLFYAEKRYLTLPEGLFSMNNVAQEKLNKLNSVFTPSAAITIQDLFSGRKEQLSKIASTISEKGQHVVLYGERGVGKTSLANVVNSILQTQDKIISIKVSCDPTETFGEIWHKVFKKMVIFQTKPSMGFIPSLQTKTFSLSNFFSIDDLKPANVIEAIEIFKSSFDGIIFLIFDEFDTIKDPEIKANFSYVIKSLSDSFPYTTLLIVGVASNVNTLIGEHKSLERCLKQVFVPRMSENELEEIIVRGLKHLEISIDEAIKKDIIKFSQGFPQYTHLLAKYAAKTAIELSLDKIERQHFNVAVDEAIENTQESIKECYRKAITVNRQSYSSYKEIVLACSLIETPNDDGFRASDLLSTLVIVTNKTLKNSSAYKSYLDELCKGNRGEILQRVGSSTKYRYKFKNPLVKAYVALREYQSANFPKGKY